MSLINTLMFCLFLALSRGHKITLQPYCISKSENVCTRGLVSDGDTVLFRGEVDFSDNPSSQYVYFQIFRTCDTKFTYLCLMEIQKDCKNANTSEICNCKVEDDYKVEVNVSLKASQSYAGARVRGTIVRSSDDEEFRSEEQLVPEIHVIQHFDPEVKDVLFALFIATFLLSWYYWHWNTYVMILYRHCCSPAYKIFNRIFRFLNKQEEGINSNLPSTATYASGTMKDYYQTFSKQKMRNKYVYTGIEMGPKLIAEVENIDEKDFHDLMIASKYGRTEKAIQLTEMGANVHDKDLKDRTPLMIASENGYTETAIKLIRMGANVHDRDRKGRTPLMIASENGHTETAIKLIEMGANVHDKDWKGLTALMIASKNGFTETAIKLIEIGANVHDKDWKGRTALMFASENGRFKTAIKLIKNGADLRDTDLKDRTPLMIASKNGYTETALKLIRMGANVHDRDRKGRTPLMIASENGHTETAIKLIEIGANVHDKDRKGRTALMLASKNGCTKTAIKLIENGANLRDKDWKGRTPLMIASENGNTSTIITLIEHGANINEVNHDKRTALMFASQNGHNETVKKLLYYGANLEAKDKDGTNALMFAFKNGHDWIFKQLIGKHRANLHDNNRTALMLACEKGHKETVSFILDSGVDIDEQDINGITALMIASENGFYDLVGLLIKNKANVDIRDKFGRTAFQLALKYGHTEIEKLLRSQYGGSTSIKSSDDLDLKENDKQTKLSSQTSLAEVKEARTDEDIINDVIVNMEPILPTIDLAFKDYFRKVIEASKPHFENPEFQELDEMTNKWIEMEWSNCRKKQGHEGFILWKDFQSDPGRYCFEYNLTARIDYIASVANLTARLVVKRVSNNRPDLYRKLSEHRGKEHAFTGTGCVVCDVCDSKNPCRCTKCEEKNSPEATFKTYSVYIETAASVVYDDEEAKNMTIELHYNDDDRKHVKMLYGVSLCERSVFGDSCVVECVTCDEQLASEIKRNLETHNVMYRAFPRSDEPIVVIISHPHGKPKHISFGECQTSHAERNELFSLTTYQYNATTCRGSSGAPVLLMNDTCSFRGSKFALLNFATHSGVNSKGVNFSSASSNPALNIKPERSVYEIKKEHVHRDQYLVSEKVEADLHKFRDSCNKNPGHPEFVPVHDFNINHLPEGCKDKDLVEFVNCLADLTVRVVVGMTSTERPEFWPNTTKPYHVSGMRGSDLKRYGTGIILLIRQIENVQQTLCSCHECQHSETPSKVYYHVYMKTGTHVVFDDLEARHMSTRLFYDTQDSPFIKLDGWSVVDSDIVGDTCYLKCETCDADVADKFLKKTQTAWGLYKTIEDKYKSEKLAIIVSHPHGHPKHVSVGQVTENITLAEGYDIILTEHSYTTCTCPGSSGAAVFMLSKDVSPIIEKYITHHVHSDALDSGLNKCSLAVAKFN